VDIYVTGCVLVGCGKMSDFAALNQTYGAAVDTNIERL